MPTDAPGEFAQSAAAWAIVATASLPVFACGRLLSRGEPFCPRWRVIPFHGTLLDWLLLFVVFLVTTCLGMAGVAATGWLEAVTGRPAADAGPLHQMAAGVVTLPVLLAAAAFLRLAAHDIPPAFHWRTVPGDAARGAVAAVVLTPAVHAVFWLTRVLNAAAGGVERDHPLTLLGVGRTPGEAAFFLLSVCLVTPWIEEVLYRGVMTRWLAARASNAWLVCMVALAFAAAPRLTWDPDAGPVLFAAGLGGLCAAVGVARRVRPRFPVRTTRTVVASSALFAAAHSAVWPTPVPLFVLACGLGYLTVRTGRITAAVVAHGLFNAVSSVLLIRHPAG